MESTVIKPTPGRRNQKAQVAQVVASSDSTVLITQSVDKVQTTTFASYGDNPILAEAKPLLALVAQIRSTKQHSDVEVLNEELQRQLRDFEANVRKHDLQPATIDKARYALCCLLDEVILNTPWGSQSSWSAKTLLSSFYSSSVGGERFYDHLEQCMKNAEQNLYLLEMKYMCMTLGFLGRYRLDTNGENEHRRLRKQVASTLKAYRNSDVTPLSGDVSSYINKGTQSSEPVPIWVIGAVTLAVLVGVYSFLSYELNRESTITFNKLMNLIPEEVIEVVPQSNEAVEQAFDKVNAMLATEVSMGLVAVDRLGDRVRITLPSQALFESGSAELVTHISPVVSKIVRTLEATTGKIIVSGHTDDRPIFTSKFPSNWHLSLARATALTEQMITGGNLVGRVIPEGLGDAKPLFDNSTEENRSKNRRVEIDLLVAN